MYNYGYEKKKYLEAKEKEENLLRLLGFPEWKIQYLRDHSSQFYLILKFTYNFVICFIYRLFCAF